MVALLERQCCCKPTPNTPLIAWVQFNYDNLLTCSYFCRPHLRSHILAHFTNLLTYWEFHVNNLLVLNAGNGCVAGGLLGLSFMIIFMIIFMILDWIIPNEMIIMKITCFYSQGIILYHSEIIIPSFPAFRTRKSLVFTRRPALCPEAPIDFPPPRRAKLSPWDGPWSVASGAEMSMWNGFIMWFIHVFSKIVTFFLLSIFIIIYNNI